MQLEDIMLSEVSQAQKKTLCFLSYTEDSRNKHIHKNKHDHTQSHMKNMFVTVELLYGTRERGKGKENDRASLISPNLTSVKVENIRMCTDSC
jgi:hypothetical protein